MMGGVPLVPEKRNVIHSAPVVKSSVPAKPCAQAGLHPHRASLEGLAVELQFEILLRLADLPALEAIVHPSPSYHRAYVARRQYIFANVVSRDKGQGVLFEAHAVAMDLTINKKDGSEIRGFLWDYKSRRRAPGSGSIENFRSLRLPPFHKSNVQSDLPWGVFVRPHYQDTH